MIRLHSLVWLDETNALHMQDCECPWGDDHWPSGHLLEPKP